MDLTYNFESVQLKSLLFVACEILPHERQRSARAYEDRDQHHSGGRQDIVADGALERDDAGGHCSQ